MSDAPAIDDIQAALNEIRASLRMLHDLTVDTHHQLTMLVNIYMRQLEAMKLAIPLHGPEAGVVHATAEPEPPRPSTEQLTGLALAIDPDRIQELAGEGECLACQ